MKKQLPDNLFDLVCARAPDSLAIVGMTKNVGKTVTLNYLVGRYAAAGLTPGLISAGYDGERFDRLTLKDKPRINAPPGALVASAKACLDAAGAVLEPLYRSRLSTPLGEVWVAKVQKEGQVELAGPGSAGGLKLLVDQMRKLGADPVLVDGAINRLASASPAVTSGVILASGAAVASVTGDVIRKTLFRCNLFETTALDDLQMEEKARDALKNGDAAVIRRDGCNWEATLLRAPIPLMAAKALKEHVCNNAAAVVLGGALIDSLLADMLTLPYLPILILRDATKIFVSPEQYYRYLNSGGQIRVLSPISLIAITLNPTDPLGKGYPPREFWEDLSAALAPRPVFDLILNEATGEI